MMQRNDKKLFTYILCAFMALSLSNTRANDETPDTAEQTQESFVKKACKYVSGIAAAIGGYKWYKWYTKKPIEYPFIISYSRNGLQQRINDIRGIVANKDSLMQEFDLTELKSTDELDVDIKQTQKELKDRWNYESTSRMTRMMDRVRQFMSKQADKRELRSLNKQIDQMNDNDSIKLVIEAKKVDEFRRAEEILRNSIIQEQLASFTALGVKRNEGQQLYEGTQPEYARKISHHRTMLAIINGSTEPFDRMLTEHDTKAAELFTKCRPPKI